MRPAVTRAPTQVGFASADGRLRAASSVPDVDALLERVAEVRERCVRASPTPSLAATLPLSLVPVANCPRARRGIASVPPTAQTMQRHRLSTCAVRSDGYATAVEFVRGGSVALTVDQRRHDAGAALASSAMLQPGLPLPHAHATARAGAAAAATAAAAPEDVEGLPPSLPFLSRFVSGGPRSLGFNPVAKRARQ